MCIRDSSNPRDLESQVSASPALNNDDLNAKSTTNTNVQVSRRLSMHSEPPPAYDFVTKPGAAHENKDCGITSEGGVSTRDGEVVGVDRLAQAAFSLGRAEAE